MKMKKSIAIGAVMAVLSFLVLLIGAQAAHTAEGTGEANANAEVKTGIMPDSFLYGIQTAIDRINLALTFDNSAKAEKGLKIAKKRLLEVQAMASQNKIEAAQKAQREHDRFLASVEKSIRKLSRSDARAEAKEEIRLEKALEEHEIEVDAIRGNLKVRMKVRGDLTAEQQTLIDSILDSLQNKTGEVRISIENKKGETKTKIRFEEGITENEIELEIRELEKQNGLLELRIERAGERISDAADRIARAKARLQSLNTSANATANVTVNMAAAAQLISEAEIRLQSARQAFNESKFGEAFGHATAAERLARNSERLLERPLSAITGDSDRRGRGEERLRIKAEAFNGSSEVKVEVRFTALSTNRSELLDELLSMVKNISKEEINQLLEIENESEQLRERTRTEIRERKGVAQVRFEHEFAMNTTDRLTLVEVIFSKLSTLTKADLEMALTAEIREDDEDEDEREIEVEVEDGIAKVKVEVDGSKFRFSVPFTNETDLFRSIAEKTGLSFSEVSSITEIEMEDEREESHSRRGRGGDDEDEAEIRGKSEAEERNGGLNARLRISSDDDGRKGRR